SRDWSSDVCSSDLDITDQEFEELLNAIADDNPSATPAPAATASDDITDDEFEALLDQLHGKGKGPAGGSQPVATPANASASDDITDDEFEALLDQLHGKGKGPASAKTAPAGAENSAPKTDN